MHIGVLTHNYPRFPGDFSGTFIEALCQELARQQQRVTIWAPYDPAYQILDCRLPITQTLLTIQSLSWKDPKSKIQSLSWKDPKSTCVCIATRSLINRIPWAICAPCSPIWRCGARVIGWGRRCWRLVLPRWYAMRGGCVRRCFMPTGYCPMAL